jgi:hypothetical protein
MAKSKTTKKTASSKNSPLTMHKFKMVKAAKKVERAPKAYASHGGVRALVVKACGRSGATPTQVAAVVARARKGYTPQAALNCLRWLQTKGFVARQ